jgi:hypothetical protein
MIAQPAVHARDGFALNGSGPSPAARAIVAGLATGIVPVDGRRGELQA